MWQSMPMSVRMNRDLHNKHLQLQPNYRQRQLLRTNRIKAIGPHFLNLPIWAYRLQIIVCVAYRIFQLDQQPAEEKKKRIT